MSKPALLFACLALGTLLSCATQVRQSGSEGLAVQVAVTDKDPRASATAIAQQHCAKYGKQPALTSVREQVIFEFACR